VQWLETGSNGVLGTERTVALEGVGEEEVEEEGEDKKEKEEEKKDNIACFSHALYRAST
jgi:hypothetical protein